MANRILLVDDDALLRRSLSFNLERAGFSVTASASSEDALAIAQRQPPDLVLLDIGLPGMDGLDGLRAFREQYAIPVIFLTARRRELDQVLGLELGADDYITKPFDVDVLIARVKAVLRRVRCPREAMPQPGRLAVGDLVVDPAKHTVVVADKQVELSPREFDLLHSLALLAGRVVPVDDLVARVWGPEFSGQHGVLYVHIRWLREKIEENPHRPRRILSIRGVGYKLEPRGA